MLLNMARDREVSLGNLLYLFHNGPDRVLWQIYSFTSEYCGAAAILLRVIYSESRKHGSRADCMARAVSCDASGRVVLEVILTSRLC